MILYPKYKVIKIVHFVYLNKMPERKVSFDPQLGEDTLQEKVTPQINF